LLLKTLHASRWLVDRASDGVSVKVLISAPIPPALKIPESEVEKTDGRLQIRAYPGSLKRKKAEKLITEWL
jgi:hypothetical protein